MTELFNFIRAMIRQLFTGEVFIDFHKGEIKKVTKRNKVDLTNFSE